MLWLWSGADILAAQEADYCPRPLRIGVLAYKGKPDALRHWAAHGDYLSQTLAPCRFDIVPLSYQDEELARAVRAGDLDFVITNPGQYCELELAGLVQHIATRRTQGPQGVLDQFGGTAIALASRADLQSYADLRGKRILIPDQSSLGGWQVHLLEAQDQGLDLRQDAQITELKDHRKVVEAILRGEGDAGFVRSDLLEELASQGLLQLDQLRVVNPLSWDGFPYRVSTRLYPEWPFAVVKKVPLELSLRVLRALLDLKPDSPAARSAGIHGWTIPGDYRRVADLFQRTGQGPYAQVEPSLMETLRRYWPLWTGLATGLALLLSLGLVLLLRSKKALWQSEILLKKSQEIAHIGSWRYDHRNCQLTISDEVYRIFGYPPGAFPATYENYLRAIHPDDRDWVEQSFLHGVANLVPFEITHRVLRPDGAVRMVWEKSEDVRDDRGHILLSMGSVHDITERWENEGRLQQAANVFRYANDGILLTDAENAILDVNEAFSRITGYSRNEAQGKRPKELLGTNRQDDAFYQGMWHGVLTQGYWRGVLWNRRKNGEEYAESLTLSAIQGRDGRPAQFVGIFSDITSEFEYQHQLEHLAHHDSLTGLPNRVLFTDRLHQAVAYTRRKQGLLAVAYMDLDGFKPVNDDYGHEVGDRLLVEIAQRVKGCIRSHDSVARLGGDEFALLLADIGSQQEGVATLERIIAAIAAPCLFDDISVTVSASIGLTLYPRDDVDDDTLLRHADQAMYRAKTSGRSRVHLFDPIEDREARTRHEERTRVVQALEQGELRLHYQPIIDMCHGTLLGAEALVRWQHPEQGLLPPSRFLHLIDDAEFAAPLGHWVLEQAIDQLQRWHQAGARLRLHVNISPHHLQGKGFIDQLKGLLAGHPVPSGALCLELVETAAMEDVVQGSRLIESCSALGIGFALDDFGTGYSSLSYFRRLPVETLKIDRGFIQDMLDEDDDLAIVEGIIGLTKALHRDVIAEGVETPQHGIALLMLGCIQAQGFAIARPMPADELLSWAGAYRAEPLWSSEQTRGWLRDDLPLLLVGQHHSHWIQRVAGFLEDQGQGTSPPILNHRQCRFGRWYYGRGQELYGQMPEFISLDELHTRVHDLARELITLKTAGQAEQARLRLPELMGVKESLLARVESLQQAVKALRGTP